MNKFLNVYLKNLVPMIAVSAGVVTTMTLVIWITFLIAQFIGGVYSLLFFVFCVFALILALVKTAAEWED
jgi:ABC-type uncharacterized transport system permease subunit